MSLIHLGSITSPDNPDNDMRTDFSFDTETRWLNVDTFHVDGRRSYGDGLNVFPEEAEKFQLVTEAYLACLEAPHQAETIGRLTAAKLRGEQVAISDVLSMLTPDEQIEAIRLVVGAL